MIEGITAPNMVCAMKHFPGDGIDERDQHVVTSYNALPTDDWDGGSRRVNPLRGLQQRMPRTRSTRPSDRG